MANSDAVLTRASIISRAFRRIGIDSPTSNEIVNATDLLNVLVKELDVGCTWAWAVSNTESSLTTVASQRAYDTGILSTTIAVDILQLAQIWQYTGGTYKHIRIIDKDESLTTYYREGTGQPIEVHLERTPLLTSQKLHIFPTPDAAYTIKYTYRRRLYDFDNATDNPDFPQDWGLRLVKILAAELAPEYGAGVEMLSYHSSQAEIAKAKGIATNLDAKALPAKGEYF